jgi:hypothetical protein
MKKLFAAVAVLSLVGAFAANADLMNGGFEIGYGSPANAQYWSWNNPEPHGGSWGDVNVENWRTHSGTNEASIRDWGVGGDDGGWWQEVTNSVGNGSTWTASFWAWNDNNYTSVTTQLKVEFYNGNWGTALSVVTNKLTLSGETWAQFSLQGTAPVDTAWTRFVLESQGQGQAGAFQFDDASLTGVVAVPEPVSAAMFGIGMIAFYALRRRIAK